MRIERRFRRQRLHQSGALLAADLDQEAIVQLGQHQVMSLGHLGAGAHRRAEAGRSGAGALHGDHERGGSTGTVVVVDERPGGERAVLDQHGGDLAGAHPQEGESRRIGDRVLESDRAVLAHRGASRHARRLGIPLPALWSHREVEEARAAGLAEPIPPGCLVIGPSRRQVSDGGDLVVDDRPVAGDRTDDGAPLVAQDLDQPVQLTSGEIPWRGGRDADHQTTGSRSRPYRSRS